MRFRVAVQNSGQWGYTPWRSDLQEYPYDADLVAGTNYEVQAQYGLVYPNPLPVSDWSVSTIVHT